MNRTHDRLFVAVIGARDAGKTTTWHSLFKHPVNTGQKVRQLTLDKAGHYADVFLISGSPEERKLYAADVLDDVDCRIILCSVQYTEGSFESTWDHIFAKEFQIYAQWLNPGHDGEEYWDRLGLANRLLAHDAVFSIRDGRSGERKLSNRVEEIRQYIHGWAAARGLVR